MLMILSTCVEPADRAVRSRPLLGAVQPVRDSLVQHLVDERRLARSRHAGHAAEDAQRHRHVDVAQVVLRRALDRDLAGRNAPVGRHGNRARARQELPGQRLLDPHHLLRRSLRDQLATVLAGARAEVDEVVGGQHRALVVLDDDHRVAEVAQPLQRRDQPLVVALVQPDRRLVEDVEHADEARTDLRRQADPLRLAARQRTPPPAPATGSRRRRCRGSAAARRSRAGSAARSGARCRSAPARRTTRSPAAPTSASTRGCRARRP